MAVRTIGTDLTLTGEKAFNDGMKSINSNLKVLRSDMAACSAEYADNADSVQALAAKNKVLSETVEQQKAKVEALQAKYKQVCDTYGESSAQADKYKVQLNQATAALAKDTRALEDNESALDNAKHSAKFTTKAAHGVTTAFKAMGKAALKTAKGMGTAAAGMAKGVGAITGAAMMAVAAVGAGGAFVLGKLTAFAVEAAEAAKTAKEAGETLTPQQEQWLAFSTQLDGLNEATAGAKAALGSVLLPQLQALSEEGAAFLNDFSTEMEGAAGDSEKQAEIMGRYIADGAARIMEHLPEWINTGKQLLKGLGNGLSESGPELLDTAGEILMDLLQGIIDNAPAMAEGGIQLIEKLITGISENGPELLGSAAEMVTQIVQGLAAAAPELIPAAASMVGQLLMSLLEHAPELLQAGLELVMGILSGIMTALSDLAPAAAEIINTIVTVCSEKLSDLLDVGKNIVKGIWEGISSGTEWIFDKITGWVDSVLDWIKKKLGIASPSKVMRDEVGAWMARGIGVGFEQEMAKVNKQIAASINTSFDIPDPRRPGGYSPRTYTVPGSGGKTVNLYFYAQRITEADINMIVDIVDRKLGDAM